MDAMHLIHFQRTGHVLGALTVLTQNDSVMIDDVAEQGFYLRAGPDLIPNTRVLINRDHLALLSQDFRSSVMNRPQNYAVTDGLAEEQDDRGIVVVVDGVTVDITLPSFVSSATEVWCLIEGPMIEETIVRPITVPNASVLGSENLSLPSGTYTIVIFAPGYTVQFFTESF